MYGHDKGHEIELDSDRPDRMAGGEPVIAQARGDATPLVDRGSACEVRFDPGRRSWSRAVRDSGDVRRVGGWGDAGEGGELRNGGHGWNSFEREGQSGLSARGTGGQKGKWQDEGRRGAAEVQGVCGNEEREKREKVEDRGGFGYVLRGLWGIHFCCFLLLFFLQIDSRGNGRAIKGNI